MSITSILVTRPGDQATELIEALARAEVSVWHLPTIKIQALPEAQEQKEIALNLERYDKVFCLSTNAAKFALRLFEGYWPQWPQPQTWYAVGQATAKVLEQALVTVQCPEQRDSEGLLSLLDKQALAGQRCLICSGEGGRTLLAESLQKHGAQVTKLPLYQRIPVTYESDKVISQLKEKQIDGIVVTSVEVLENLITIFEAWVAILKPLPLVVPSERVKTRATYLGFKHVVLAQGADTASLMAAITDQ